MTLDLAVVRVLLVLEIAFLLRVEAFGIVVHPPLRHLRVDEQLLERLHGAHGGAMSGGRTPGCSVGSRAECLQTAPGSPAVHLAHRGWTLVGWRRGDGGEALDDVVDGFDLAVIRLDYITQTPTRMSSRTPTPDPPERVEKTRGIVTHWL